MTETSAMPQCMQKLLPHVLDELLGENPAHCHITMQLHLKKDYTYILATNRFGLVSASVGVISRIVTVKKFALP